MDESEHLARLRRRYLVAAAIVWVAIIGAFAAVARGTDSAALLLTTLGGGAVFFLVLLPAGLFRR